MPIYRYRCAACDAEDEVLANFGDDPPEKCAACGAEGSLSKLVARTAFHLKGGGWYAQGYGSGGAASPSEASSGGDEATASKSDGKSESKSEGSSSSSSDGGSKSTSSGSSSE